MALRVSNKYKPFLRRSFTFVLTAAISSVAFGVTALTADVSSPNSLAPIVSSPATAASDSYVATISKNASNKNVYESNGVDKAKARSAEGDSMNGEAVASESAGVAAEPTSLQTTEEDVAEGMDADASMPSPSTSDNGVEEQIYSILTAPIESGGGGLTKSGAVAVMGCIAYESGFNPTAENVNDGGYGLLQWTNVANSDRKSKLLNYLDSNGYSRDSIEGQMAFAIQELKTIFSNENGYAYPVYETLTSSESIAECLQMFFSHAEAGTNVEISNAVYYGSRTTQELYDNRYAAAYGYYTTFG